MLGGRFVSVVNIISTIIVIVFIANVVLAGLTVFLNTEILQAHGHG